MFLNLSVNTQMEILTAIRLSFHLLRFDSTVFNNSDKVVCYTRTTVILNNRVTKVDSLYQIRRVRDYRDDQHQLSCSVFLIDRVVTFPPKISSFGGFERARYLKFFMAVSFSCKNLFIFLKEPNLGWLERRFLFFRFTLINPRVRS